MRRTAEVEQPAPVTVLLRAHLPDEPWRPLVTSFGYSIGFVMVVLSRQQLFTENTVTVVLPSKRSGAHLS